MARPAKKPKVDKHEGSASRAVTIGVFVGTGRKVQKTSKTGLTPIGKGANVYAYCVDHDDIREYVDLNKVQSRSIWAYPELVGRPAYAFSEIGFAPQAGILDTTRCCLNKSAILFVPDRNSESFPWDAYFNSIVPRYIFAVVLRSATLDAGTISPVTGVPEVRAHIHARVVETLPVSIALMNSKDNLVPLADELRQLAIQIHRRWRSIGERIQHAPKKTLALCEVDFSGWTDLSEDDELRLLSDETMSWLQAYDEAGQQKLCRLTGGRALLNVVLYLLEQGAAEGTITRAKLENLEVPQHPQEISILIDNAGKEDSPDIVRFKDLLGKVDRIVIKAFGLTEEEAEYIRERLASPPLNNFQPRFPWRTAAARAIKTYEEDRFA